jgi:hypothetical protein
MLQLVLDAGTIDVAAMMSLSIEGTSCQGSPHREHFILQKAHHIVNSCRSSQQRIKFVHALSHKERAWTIAMNSNGGDRQFVYG